MRRRSLSFAEVLIVFCLAGGAGQTSNSMAGGMHEVGAASPGAEALLYGVGRRLGGELHEPDGPVRLDPQGGCGAVEQERGGAAEPPPPHPFLGRSGPIPQISSRNGV